MKRWAGLSMALVAGAFVSTATLFGPAMDTASAQARPDTRSMTCAQAQNFVRQRGAVVMTTGRNTFERIVASARYCPPQQNFLRRFNAETSDARHCQVGFTCGGRPVPSRN